MTNPLQTVAACAVCNAMTVAKSMIARTLITLFCRVIRRQRLQPLHPKHRGFIFLRFERGDRRIRAHRRINAGVEDLRQILRLLGFCFAADHEERANRENGERSSAGPSQSADVPPGYALSGAAAADSLRRAFASDRLPQLVMEELFVAHCRRDGELLFQERAELERVPLLCLRGDTIRQRNLERRELLARELIIDPSRPLFLKRFHKHPSISSAAFSARKIVATSRCRSSSRGSRRFRGTACLPFLSLKSLPGVPATVAELPRRSARESPCAPSARAVQPRPSGRCALPGRPREPAVHH